MTRPNWFNAYTSAAISFLCLVLPLVCEFDCTLLRYLIFTKDVLFMLAIYKLVNSHPSFLWCEHNLHSILGWLEDNIRIYTQSLRAVSKKVLFDNVEERYLFTYLLTFLFEFLVFPFSDQHYFNIGLVQSTTNAYTQYSLHSIPIETPASSGIQFQH